MIEPPSRQSNDYFYYRPDSPHYEDDNHHDDYDLSTSASNRNFEYERKVDDFAIEDLGRSSMNYHSTKALESACIFCGNPELV